ncbi:MAG: NADH-quinone oxidoreductase subunit N [Candidatus Micrarchaeia archaeon]|jgi:NADH-quinone oxidoreductase subunit N
MISLFGMLALSVALLVLVNIVVRAIGNKKAQFAATMILLSASLFFILDILVQGSFGWHMLRLVDLNPFSVLLSAIIAAGMLAIQVIAFRESVYEDFAVFSSFSFLGMLLVAMAGSIATIFIGLELLTVPTVFSLLLSKKWIEPGIKYFVVTALSAGLFAFGTAVLFLSTGNLQLSPQAYNMGSAIAFVMLLVSIGIESGVFPFNLWIPDVYSGAPAFITAMLGGFNKKIGIVALAYITLVLFPYFSQSLLILFSILTMFYGNLAALAQRNAKRMLAYSSISQVGFILIGFSAMSTYGVSASIIQIFAHMFAFIGALAIVAFFESSGRVEINDYIGLHNESKLAAFALAVFLLSMVGVPFTIGFVGKLMLFASAVSSNLAWLAVLGIINTVISIYYYAKLIIAIYTNKAYAKPIRLGAGIYAVVAACLLIVLLFGIYPAMLFNLAQSAASSIQI